MYRWKAWCRALSKPTSRSAQKLSAELGKMALTEEQLARARKEQEEAGGRLTDVLLSEAKCPSCPRSCATSTARA